MMKVLKAKKILIISPQPWSNMWISKHHYAIGLSTLGNTVYFLNPPTPQIKHGSCSVRKESESNVFVIDYRPVFPMRWKFKFNGFFNFIMKYEVKKIINAIGGKPDIVWDFEPNRQFIDLSWFGAEIKIYHPVDATPLINNDVKKADIILSVSDVILNYFKNSSVPRYFINHGLGAMFSSMAIGQLKKLDHPIAGESSEVNFGYVGNLLMRYIDHELFKAIISENTKIKFHIWGPYDYSKMNGSEPDTSKIVSFIEFLKGCENVTLYGIQSHKEIIPKMTKLDAFFWCYDNERDPNQGSNSHKILEYLSTGKVVVSTYVSTYKDLGSTELMIMSKTSDEYKKKFKEVALNMTKYNSADLMRLRMQLALKNTYSSHIEYVDELLSTII